jgi:drug/metabolite transporter (DMT)-like permease
MQDGTVQRSRTGVRKHVRQSRQFATGIAAALSSALFLGFTPIFGKQAILFGMPPLAVVAIRTVLAALILLCVMFAFQRQYFYIYPAGLMGCFLAGGINGIGSLLYYSSLGRIDASVGQLLYSFYPLFVALWLTLDHQPLNRLTLVRLILVLPALYLLTQTGQEGVDMLGMAMMLGASALYALHLPINQRVLFDMPAPTVTLYTLIAMSAVVTPAYLLSAFGNLHLAYWASISGRAWWAVLGLTMVTFFSRLTLFLGVKHLGGMQTALLGLSELLVTVVFAQFLLGERLSQPQWAGTVLLVITLLMVRLDKTPPKGYTPGGWLRWLRPPSLPSDFPWQPHD